MPRTLQANFDNLIGVILGTAQERCQVDDGVATLGGGAYGLAVQQIIAVGAIKADDRMASVTQLLCDHRTNPALVAGD
jgi:hypothetical protein